MVKSKRMMDVDIVKSIGIILMIMGHIEFGNKFDFYIHSFHMPLFFLMAGYVYKDYNKSFLMYTYKKFRNLIVPYFFVGLLHYFIKIPYIIKNNDNLFNPLKHLIWDNSDGLAISGALWFLTSLFFAYEMMFIILKINNQIFQLIVTIFVIIIGGIVPGIIKLPWSMGSSLTCFGFIYIGKKWREKTISFNLVIYLIFITSGLFIASFNEYVNVRIEQYGNIFLFYISALLTIFGLHGLIKRIEIEDNIVFKELQFVGINSIIYMCFNQLIVWLPNIIIDRFSGLILILLKVLELIVIMLLLKVLAKKLANSRLWNVVTGRI